MKTNKEWIFNINEAEGISLLLGDVMFTVAQIFTRKLYTHEYTIIYSSDLHTQYVHVVGDTVLALYQQHM